MAKQASKNTIVPVLPTELTTQEENTTMETTQEVIQDTQEVNNAPEQTAQNSDVPQENNAPEQAAPQAAPEQDSVYVTLAQIEAYQPQVIDAQVAELQSKHDAVNMFSKTMAKEVLDNMRSAVGISDSFENDKTALLDKLGGKVAPIMDKIKDHDDSAWNTVQEYALMRELLDQVNETRAKLGLGLIAIHMSGRTKGASASVNASIHPKRTSGYMRAMTLTGNAMKQPVKWVATLDNIAVFVNGQSVWTGKQGEKSLSWIHNERVLPFVGATEKSRESFPAWLIKNGYSPDEVMLQAAPNVQVEK